MDLCYMIITYYKNTPLLKELPMGFPTQASLSLLSTFHACMRVYINRTCDQVSFWALYTCTCSTIVFRRYMRYARYVIRPKFMWSILPATVSTSSGLKSPLWFYINFLHGCWPIGSGFHFFARLACQEGMPVLLKLHGSCRFSQGGTHYSECSWVELVQPRWRPELTVRGCHAPRRQQLG